MSVLEGDILNAIERGEEERENGDSPPVSPTNSLNDEDQGVLPDDLNLQLMFDVVFAGKISKRFIQERNGSYYVSSHKPKPLFAVVRGHGLFFYKDPSCFKRVKPHAAMSLRTCFIDATTRLAHENGNKNPTAFLHARKDRGREKEYYQHTTTLHTSDKALAITFDCAEDAQRFLSCSQTFGLESRPEKVDLKDKRKKLDPRNMLVAWLPRGSDKGEESKVTQTKTFGLSLQEYLLIRAELTIPVIVRKCIDEVAARGLDIEGIYRMAGGKAVIQTLRDAFDENENAVNLSDDDRWTDIHCISNLLKQYLRSLPESLGTNALYQHFITIGTALTGENRVLAMAYLVQNQLPTENRNTLAALMSHLTSVVEMSHLNKMKIENLAIVFGPTLFFANNSNALEMAQDTAAQCKIVEIMLDKYEQVFLTHLDPSSLSDDLKSVCGAFDYEDTGTADCLTAITSPDPGCSSPLINNAAPRRKTTRLSSMVFGDQEVTLAQGLCSGDNESLHELSFSTALPLDTSAEHSSQPSPIDYVECDSLTSERLSQVSSVAETLENGFTMEENMRSQGTSNNAGRDLHIQISADVDDLDLDTNSLHVAEDGNEIAVNTHVTETSVERTGSNGNNAMCLDSTSATDSKCIHSDAGRPINTHINNCEETGEIERGNADLLVRESSHIALTCLPECSEHESVGEWHAESGAVKMGQDEILTKSSEPLVTQVANGDVLPDLKTVLETCGTDSSLIGNALTEYLIQSVNKSKQASCTCQRPGNYEDMDVERDENVSIKSCSCVNDVKDSEKESTKIAEDVFNYAEKIGVFSLSSVTPPAKQTDL